MKRKTFFVRLPADVNLAKLEVGGGVVVGELGVDVGKVDAGGGPGRVEGNQPGHLNNAHDQAILKLAVAFRSKLLIK